ncbi:MAG: hypothetical protein KC423_03290 [Anaerolineales bacterium]|nr:hypothetical protein [Anaerolineales bacterium]
MFTSSCLSVPDDFYRKSFNGEKAQSEKKSIQAEENEFIVLRRKVALIDSLYIQRNELETFLQCQLPDEENGQTPGVTFKTKLEEWNMARETLVTLSLLTNDPDREDAEVQTLITKLKEKYTPRHQQQGQQETNFQEWVDTQDDDEDMQRLKESINWLYLPLRQPETSLKESDNRILTENSDLLNALCNLLECSKQDQNAKEKFDKWIQINKDLKKVKIEGKHEQGYSKLSQSARQNFLGITDLLINNLNKLNQTCQSKMLSADLAWVKGNATVSQQGASSNGDGKEEKITDRPPIGLAFSGGGIRSATFNLGLAQGLSKLGILPWVDYLSSISGGGYAAATLTSLTSKRSEFGPHWKNFPFNPDIKVFDWEDEEKREKIVPSTEIGANIQLRHMRNYGNFIIPRLGTATADTIGLIGNTLPSFLYTLILFLLAIFSLSTLHYGITALLAPSILEDKTFVSVQSTPAAPTVAEPSADKQTTQETAASEPTTAPIDVTLYEQGELTITARGVETTTVDGEALGLPLLERSGITYFAQKAKTGASYFELVRSSMMIEPEETGNGSDLQWWQFLQQLKRFLKDQLEFSPIHLFIIGVILAIVGSYIVLLRFYKALYIPEFTGEEKPQYKLLSLSYFIWWIKHRNSLSSEESKNEYVDLTAEYTQIRQIRMVSLIVSLIAMALAIVAYKVWILPKEGDNIYAIWMPLFLTLGATAGLIIFRLVPLRYGRSSKDVWSKASFRALVSSLQGLNLYAVLIILALTILILPQFYDDQSPRLLDEFGFTFPTTAGLLTLLGNLLLNYTAKQEQKSSQASDDSKLTTLLQRLLSFSFRVQVIVLSILVILFNLSLIFLFQSRLDDNLTQIASSFLFDPLWGLIILLLTTSSVIYVLWVGKVGLVRKWQNSKPIRTALGAISIIGIVAFALGYAFDCLFNLLGRDFLLAKPLCAVAIILGIVVTFLVCRLVRTKISTDQDCVEPRKVGPFIAGVSLLSGFLVYLFVRYLPPFIVYVVQLEGGQAARLFYLAFLALAWFYILGRVINFNYVSHHYFYRDRMMNAYLATHLGTDPIQDARYDGRLRLAQINPDGSSSPYHLINGAINLTNSADLRFKDRKSQHFLFSKYYCGSEVTGYVKTRYYRDGRTKLSRAIAVSGAAASSSVGYVTFFAQAFITTILNFRLGLWMTNPKKYEGLNLETYRQLAERFEKRSNWIPYLWNEMRGQISEREGLVNLSDGGHTGDNGALYPLFQRRCQIIIVGDASRDHGYKFTDLFHVLLQVKADFNIDVDINVDGIRPDENGESAFHCAVGVIQYPRDEYNPAMKGYLLYFKPNMTGKEPSSLKEYRKQYEKGFPHVSTTDLFFNERQFEAYREIGWLSIERTRQDLVNYYERKIEEKKKKLEANKARRRQVLDMLRLLQMGNVKAEQLLAELFSKASSAKELIDLLEKELSELNTDDKELEGAYDKLKEKQEAVKNLGEKNKFDKYLSGFLGDLREATTVPEKEKK